MGILNAGQMLFFEQYLAIPSILCYIQCQSSSGSVSLAGYLTWTLKLIQNQLKVNASAILP